ncbi:MAG: arginine repressor [Clostridiales Family XIII bacterium]|jgi:transcriptional regulator of arginine metabolism|nr:arginine repressor [Clostridiales Family XIII bacterium]
MRYTRQNKIVELISKDEIDTQERLAEALKSSGFEVTQATVSRDIKELQLIKTLTPSGKYKYALPDAAGRQQVERFSKIFRDTVQSVASSGNMIVVKTMTGCANAACEAIDSLDFPHILGSIAGDNTVFLVADDAKHVASVVERFEGLLRA